MPSPQDQNVVTIIKNLPKQPPPPDGPGTLSSVLAKYPGFSKVYNPDNTSIIFAPPARTSQNGGRGSLEYWPPDEEGDAKFPRPMGYDKKHVLEIYDPILQRDPQKLHDAVYGDLLHGMVNDPAFAAMRQQFISNYRPDVAAYNKHLMTTRKGLSPNSIDDMFIRGRLAKNQGKEWESPDRYSPQQLQILDQMKKYIETGK